MSSPNSAVVLSREEFHVKVSDAFDSRTHKKIPRIGCPHFKGKVKHIRNEDNSIEDSLCDIADNVEGKASVDNLENIGFWIELLYSEDDNKPVGQKVEVWAQDIKGIIYYIDKIGNVYQVEDIIVNKINPKVIAKYIKNGDNYSIPEFNI